MSNEPYIDCINEFSVSIRNGCHPHDAFMQLANAIVSRIHSETPERCRVTENTIGIDEHGNFNRRMQIDGKPLNGIASHMTITSVRKFEP